MLASMLDPVNINHVFPDARIIAKLPSANITGKSLDIRVGDFVFFQRTRSEEPFSARSANVFPLPRIMSFPVTLQSFLGVSPVRAQIARKRFLPSKNECTVVTYA